MYTLRPAPYSSFPISKLLRCQFFATPWSWWLLARIGAIVTVLSILTTVAGDHEGSGNGNEGATKWVRVTRWLQQWQGWWASNSNSNEEGTVAMTRRVAGKDEYNGKGSKSNGNGAKKAITRKWVMLSDNNNRMTVTETTTQHCCHCHR